MIESFLYGQVADFNETSEAQLEDSFIHILNLELREGETMQTMGGRGGFCLTSRRPNQPGYILIQKTLHHSAPITLKNSIYILYL